MQAHLQDKLEVKTFIQDSNIINQILLGSSRNS